MTVSLLLQRSPTKEQQVYSSSDRQLARTQQTAITSINQLCSSPHRPVHIEKLGRFPSCRPPKPASDRWKDFSSTTHRTGKISVAPHSPVAEARIARPARSQSLPAKPAICGQSSPTFFGRTLWTFQGHQSNRVIVVISTCIDIPQHYGGKTFTRPL
jgi:hypothetical protein